MWNCFTMPCLLWEASSTRQTGYLHASRWALHGQSCAALADWLVAGMTVPTCASCFSRRLAAFTPHNCDQAQGHAPLGSLHLPVMPLSCKP